MRCHRCQRESEDWADPVGILCTDCADVQAIEYRNKDVSETIRRMGVPTRYRKCLPETVDPEVWAELRDWKGKPEFVLIHGPFGSGKTWTATALMVHRVLTDPRVLPDYVLWTTAVRLLDRMRDSMSGPGDLSRAEVRAAHAPALLLLDDIGAEKSTEWALERLTETICYRYDWEKPTIVTSNLDPEKLYGLNARAASRICSGIVIELNGTDRRLARRTG